MGSLFNGLIFLLLLTVSFHGVCAQEKLVSSTSDATGSHFSFLEREVTMTSAKTPANWTQTYETKVFRAKELGRADRVLLEHPKDIKHSLKFSRPAMHFVHGPDKKRLESEKTMAEIETTTTWVNLDHALAISEVPSKPIDFKLDVNVSLSSNEPK